MYLGWTQVAFDEDLTDDVVPVDVAGRALVAVRGPTGMMVYDGRCPHRGAHLGYGGRLDDVVVVCPFHGHRIHLVDDDGDNGCRSAQRFRVAAYPSLHVAGGLFVLLDRSHDTRLADRLTSLTQTHHVRPALARALSVPPEYIIENVLDADHFATVHALTRRPQLEIVGKSTGSLRVDGWLDMVRPNKWQQAVEADAGARARFSAEIFSPTLVVTELGSGDDVNVVITAATPTAEGGCLARVTVALPRESGRGKPTVHELSSLISGSRTAFEQDAFIWDHLDTSVTPHYVESDRLVRTYRDFCLRFLVPSVSV
jgi:phenylpropionate dioxygenase-like ring-hydroxylating dioxygenase large terminal subunit